MSGLLSPARDDSGAERCISARVQGAQSLTTSNVVTAIGRRGQWHELRSARVLTHVRSNTIEQHKSNLSRKNSVVHPAEHARSQQAAKTPRHVPCST